MLSLWSALPTSHTSWAQPALDAAARSDQKGRWLGARVALLKAAAWLGLEFFVHTGTAVMKLPKSFSDVSAHFTQALIRVRGIVSLFFVGMRNPKRFVSEYRTLEASSHSGLRGSIARVWASRYRTPFLLGIGAAVVLGAGCLAAQRTITPIDPAANRWPLPVRIAIYMVLPNVVGAVFLIPVVLGLVCTGRLRGS